LPDLLRRAAVMGAPVCIARVLVGIEILFRLLCGKFACFPNRAVRSFASVGENDLSAIGENGALAFLRNVSRHAQGHREALRSSQHGISNSSIAARRIQ